MMRFCSSMGIKVILGTALILSFGQGTVCPAEEDKGAFYEYRHYEYQVTGNTYTETGRVRLVITNPRGQKYADFCFYENSYIKIMHLEYKLIDSNGKTLTKGGKNDMLKICGYDNVAIYSDNCGYCKSLKAPTYPYVIEYEYKTRSSTLFFLREEVFQSDIPVNLVTYTLSVPSGFDLSHKIYNSDLEPEIDIGDKTTVYKWIAKDLPAYDTETDYIPFNSIPIVALRLLPHKLSLESYVFSGNDWFSIGEWYVRLADDRYSPTPLLPVAGGEAMVVIKDIFDYITENIRYVAIGVKESGWQPYPASYTAEKKYGDCKGMTALLVSELNRRGITAYPCHLLTRDEGKIDVDFPSFQFNHVIAMAIAGSDTLWLDPTCENCRFDQLPSGDADVDILVVTDGGYIRHTPAARPEDNLFVRTTDLHLAAGKGITFTTRYAIRGSSEVWLRGALKSGDQDEDRRLIDGISPGAGNKYRIESYAVSGLEDKYDQLELNITAAMLRPADQIANTIYCSPLPFGQLNLLEMVPLDDRLFPIDLSSPRLTIDSVRITRDPALAVDSILLPTPVKEQYDFGWFSLEAQKAGDTVLVTFAKAYTAYQVDTTQFDQFLDFRSKLNRLHDCYVKYVLH